MLIENTSPFSLSCNNSGSLVKDTYENIMEHEDIACYFLCLLKIKKKNQWMDGSK